MCNASGLINLNITLSGCRDFVLDKTLGEHCDVLIITVMIFIFRPLQFVQLIFLH